MADQDNDSVAGAGSITPNFKANGAEDLSSAYAGIDREPEVSIDGYVKMREITRGGQAVVFSAIQQSTGRRVAIKLIKDRPFENSIEKSRLDREVRILAALDHPHIVSVIDRGVTRDGFLYFILNYVDGQTLTKYMEECRRSRTALEIYQDPADILRLFMRMCDAVNAAHLRGVVHRDLKPSNVIVDNHGEPHILDFGLARSSMPLLSTDEDLNPVTTTGQFIGSLQWASPEQAEGIPGKVDTRSDVYALGVMLYQMLTGGFPYDVQSTLKEVLDHILLTQPKPPSEVLIKDIRDQSGKKVGRVRAELMKAADAVVLKALAKKREERYQTAGEMARDLQRILSGHATDASKAQAQPSPWQRIALLQTLLGITAAAAVVVNSPKPVAVPAPAPVVTNFTAAVQGDPPFGYRIDQQDIVFEFDARRFNNVRLPNGMLGNVSNLVDIATVVVVGPFNGWIPGREGWKMTRIDKDRHELRKPVSAMGEASLSPFKFVLNGNIWVSAPAEAPNREVVLTDSASYNLIFRNPFQPVELPQQTLDLYRRHINSHWRGFGGNLAMDDRYRFFFTLSGREIMVQELDLEPLSGVPLTGLNLFDLDVKSFDPLSHMYRLEFLVLSDMALKSRFQQVDDNLARGEFGLAQRALERIMQPLEEVPAFSRFNKLMAESIYAMKKLAQHPGQIPPGAKLFQGRTYVLIVQPMTWPEAVAYGAKHGGHVCTITTPDELGWILSTYSQNMLGHSIWIGATDEASEGQWQWVNGEPWKYENWTGGEPNNQNGSEHAIEMKADGWWHDVEGGSFRYPFIIEWDS